MRLTRFSDIGLQVLMYLCREPRDTAPVTVAEIAFQFNVPHNHVVKVVGRLAKLGLLTATRGRHGGIRLARPSSEIRVGRVLREIEGVAELADCDGQECCLKGNCRLRGALAVGLNSFYETMDRYTLADITGGATGDQIVHMHRDYRKNPAAETV
jgi:Rrf2 family nitric oxide-sensitive transcriptional repressor